MGKNNVREKYISLKYAITGTFAFLGMLIMGSDFVVLGLIVMMSGIIIFIVIATKYLKCPKCGLSLYSTDNAFSMYYRPKFSTAKRCPKCGCDWASDVGEELDEERS